MENNIPSVRPNCIALIFNGQTTINAQYVGVFTTDHSTNCNDIECVSLVMLLMEDETKQTVDQHIEFLSYTLTVFESVFDNSFVNISALIVENYNTNRFVAPSCAAR